MSNDLYEEFQSDSEDTYLLFEELAGDFIENLEELFAFFTELYPQDSYVLLEELMTVHEEVYPEDSYVFLEELTGVLDESYIENTYLSYEQMGNAIACA